MNGQSVDRVWTECGQTGEDVDAVSFRNSLHHQVGGARVGHLAPLQGLFQDFLFGM